jgi:signal transduction histidine kinase
LRLEAIELNRELKAAQLQLAEKSRENERLRIARDMHDLLGHQLTALILNLEVATHKTTGAALTHVEQSLALAKLLLSDLRNAVSELRENPPMPFRTALANLIANVPELGVKLDMDENFEIPDGQAAEALLRCIQEALTNTLRHANAHTCVIRLYTRRRQVVLEIEDDGRSTATITPGNGLNGMKERIEALAGSLRWQNSSGSFFLQAQLPVHGALS